MVPLKALGALPDLCLGLRHNFVGTADLKNLAENEFASTVMDYQMDFEALIEPGPYDIAAIAYAYDGDKSLYEGKQFMYATDGSEATNPLSNQWDTGDALSFYMAEYKQFRKLRDGDHFSSGRAYSRAQRKALEAIRKFVNRGDRSQEAFDFLIQALTQREPEPPYNARERLAAMSVLASPGPKLLTGANETSRFEDLTEQQQAAVANALIANAQPGAPDDFDLRIAMVDTMKAMGNIYGYKALQALRPSLKTGSAPRSATVSASASSQDEELAVRVRQYIASYFTK